MVKGMRGGTMTSESWYEEWSEVYWHEYLHEWLILGLVIYFPRVHLQFSHSRISCPERLRFSSIHPTYCSYPWIMIHVFLCAILIVCTIPLLPGAWRRTTVATQMDPRHPGASRLCLRWGRLFVYRSNAVQTTLKLRVHCPLVFQWARCSLNAI